MLPQTKHLLVSHHSLIYSEDVRDLQIMTTTFLKHLSNTVTLHFKAHWLKNNSVGFSYSLNNSLAGLSLSYELNKKVWPCPIWKKRPFDPLYCSALNHWHFPNAALSKHCFVHKGESLWSKTENHFSLEPETWGRKVICFCELHVCSLQASGKKFKS